MESRLYVSSAAHLHNKESVSKIMWMVVISLLPAAVAGVFIFGIRAFWVILFAVLSALATEGIVQKLSGRKITLFDGSACVTGLLLAFNLPPDVPFWLPIIGSFFAMFIGKHIFGGLGKNIFNPALAGRAFLMASWPRYMTAFTLPTYKGFSFNYDAVASATPLAMVRENRLLEQVSYMDLLLGKRGGCIGETCIVVLLIGALFLYVMEYIDWHIPITYIVTTGVVTYIFGASELFCGDWLFHILSGGLILGAFFMATDYVTSPLTQKGQIVFGVGCGVLTSIIRIWGGYPEGVCYAILMMNAAVPLIDRHLRGENLWYRT